MRIFAYFSTLAFDIFTLPLISCCLPDSQPERYAAIGADCKFDDMGTNVSHNPCLKDLTFLAMCIPDDDGPFDPCRYSSSITVFSQPEWGQCIATLKQNLIAATCIAAMISTLGAPNACM